MWVPIIGAGIGAAGSIISSWLNKPSQPKQRRETRPPPQFTPKETKIQRTKRKLVDDLIYSMKNPDGNFSDLYKQPTEEDFQKYYVDPAKSRFQNQIAPGIQERYVTSGQHRGSGLEGALARSGIDMDQLLNQDYMRYQQDSLNRRQQGINSIFGSENGPTPQNIPQPGPQQDYSTSSALKQGTAGYLASDSFRNTVNDILSSFNKQGDGQDQRRGFQS
jgi:hypothetical protein